MDTKHDNVKHPAHYETGKFECIEVMEEVFGIDAVKSFCLCNAFKYLYRTNRKNGREDLEKADWYIQRWLMLDDKQKTEEDTEFKVGDKVRITDPNSSYYGHTGRITEVVCDAKKQKVRFIASDKSDSFSYEASFYYGNDQIVKIKEGDIACEEKE